MTYTIWGSLEQIERYAQRRYRHWDQRWLSRREDRIIRSVLERFEVGGSILDAPVGYGRFQSLLAEFGSVQAVDFNYYAVLYEKVRVGLAQGSVNAIAEALPYRDDAFDSVISIRLLQHIHESQQRKAILREFQRVSRCWVLASMYIQSPLHRLHRRLFRRPAKITMLMKAAALAEFQEEGLQPVAWRPVLPGLHAHVIGLFKTE